VSFLSLISSLLKLLSILGSILNDPVDDYTVFLGVYIVLLIDCQGV